MIAATAAVVSAVVAAALFRETRRRQRVELFISVAGRLGTGEYLDLKKTVYELRRDAHADWSEELTDRLDRWCGQLDLLALLLHYKQIDREATFMFYGDVVLRSVYQLAPYVNAEREKRGPQYMQPLQLVLEDLIDLWERLHKEGRYTPQIHLESHTEIGLSPDSLRTDVAVKLFLNPEQAGGR